MLPLASKLYSRVIDLRNLLYDRGVFEIHDLGARTISVGNITTGGTGKTPLVAFIAGLLLERGETVCILTRGYGRKNPSERVLVSDGHAILADAERAGDEPYELALKFNGQIIIIADANRVSAGEWAKRKFDVTAFVLDDGFQHRKVQRDLDIVCINATRPGGETHSGTLDSGRILPAGRLRENVSGLARAEVVVITRAEQATDEAISNLKSEISDLAPDTKVFLARNTTLPIKPIETFLARPSSAAGEEVVFGSTAFAFCGLGNPDAFFNTLRLAGVDLAATETFPDHHRYAQTDIARIENLAGRCQADRLITTAKDAVKLSNIKFQIPCYVVEAAVAIDDADAFDGFI